MRIRGRLGKNDPKPHRLTLNFNDFVPAGPLPVPPEKVYWEYKIPEAQLGMFGNDKYGDCVWAWFAHRIMMTTAHTATLVTPTLDQVLEAYAGCTGFDPATGANDNGTAMTDAFAYWQSTGIAGHKILGWAAVDWKQKAHVDLAIDLFGALDMGVQLPASAESQFDNGKPWDVVSPDGGIRGGHCVGYEGSGSQGDTCITWAARQRLGNRWNGKYADEAYVVISDDWFDITTGLSPSHFNRDSLWAAIKAMPKPA
ncbi:MAG: hypothetical protein WBE20_16155 [Candidatus Acidiferrales bacterium]